MDCSRDCAFCGYAADKKPRQDTKLTPEGLMKKYPCTIRYIFRKIYPNHKKTCNFCYSLLITAVKKIPESIFMVHVVDEYKEKHNSNNSEATNQETTNGISRTFNQTDQSEKTRNGTKGIKRMLEELANTESPSKNLMEAEHVYHVLVNGNTVKVVEEPKLFVKKDGGRGRPPVSPVMVDVCADILVEGGSSAGKSSIQKVLIDKHLVGRIHKKSQKDGDLWSKQTSLRCLSIKYLASDLELCRWLANQRSMFGGFDGCTGEDRHFMEFHITGVDKRGDITKQCLKIVEINGPTTGPAMAKQFCDILDDLVRVALSNSIPITTLLNIDGLNYDTTSENTGEFNGIVKKIDDARRKLWETVQAKLPESSRRPYEPLLQIPCCDHVSSLIMVHFLKDIVITLKEQGHSNLVQENRCIIEGMFESFGNLLNGDDGERICTSIRESVKKHDFKTSLNISFQKVDATRYLSLPVLVEKFLEFEKFITIYMERALATNSLTDVQKKH